MRGYVYAIANLFVIFMILSYLGAYRDVLKTGGVMSNEEAMCYVGISLIVLVAHVGLLIYLCLEVL